MILVAMTSATARIADTGPLTTTALIVIAMFAVLVIIGILWGAKQKRIRAAGEREEEDRNETLAAHPPTAPAPPPLGDAGITSAVPPTAPPLEPVSVASPKVAATPKPKAKPAAKTAPKPAAAKPTAPAVAEAAPRGATGPAANYRMLDVKGLGSKAVPMLAALGVDDLAALGRLSDARAAEIDGQLGALSGRLSRDRWVEQAKLLAAGDIAAFEKTYGKL